MEGVPLPASEESVYVGACEALRRATTVLRQAIAKLTHAPHARRSTKIGPLGAGVGAGNKTSTNTAFRHVYAAIPKARLHRDFARTLIISEKTAATGEVPKLIKDHIRPRKAAKTSENRWGTKGAARSRVYAKMDGAFAAIASITFINQVI